MSADAKRPLIRALADLDAFTALIKPDLTCERWEVAGSVRRRKTDVGDIDLVCIPKFGDVPVEGDLFGSSKRMNLLWLRVDDLLQREAFTKHVRQTAIGSRVNWGQTARSIAFRGWAYDVTCADEDNFGPWMAIKTGPSDFSARLVTELPKRGYECRDGFHLHDKETGGMIRRCTEEQFIIKSGLPLLPPEERR